MSDYFWWAGTDEEHYTVGPCESREEVIARGKEDFDDAFYIVEAYQRSVDFTQMFDADEAIERWTENDESMTDENGEVPFTLTPEQIAELDGEVKAAIRAWSSRNGLDGVKLYWFAGQRNAARIPGPDEEGNDDNV